MKDIFKAMGVTVGETNLLNERQGFAVKSFEVEGGQIVRKGAAGNPGDRLQEQIEKGFASAFGLPMHTPRHAAEMVNVNENLKNTHGEQFHSDNDKQVEELVSTAEGIDRMFEIEYVENPFSDFGINMGSRKEDVKRSALDEVCDLIKGAPGKKGEGSKGGKIIGHTSSGKPIYASGKNSNYKDFSGRDHHEAYVAHNVMSERAHGQRDYESAAKHSKQQAYHKGSWEAHETLGNKIPSFEQSRRRVKLAGDDDAKKSAVVETTEDLVLKALSDLDKGLRAPRQAKDPEQAKEERKQKKELLGKWAKKSEREEEEHDLIEMAEDPFDPETIANVHENSDGVAEKRIVKSGLDELCDLVKGAPVQAVPQQVAQPRPVKTKIAFVKSAGPGGIVFDFGHLTGNPIADNASALLNRHGDPVQQANAEYHAKSYDKALCDFTRKGEAAFETTASPFGNIDKAWDRQLNTSMDEQVKEAFDKGALQPESRSAPAVVNDFNQTTMNVNGEVIKATSETDAALIKMMQEQGMDLSGMGLDGPGVADCRYGGKVGITADLTN